MPHRHVYGCSDAQKARKCYLIKKKSCIYTQLCHIMLKQCWHHRGRWLCVPEWEPCNSENQHCLSRTITRMQKGSLSMYSRMMKYSLKTVSLLRLCSTFVFLEKISALCFSIHSRIILRGDLKKGWVPVMLHDTPHWQVHISVVIHALI